MTKMYRAENLDAIANHFSEMASRAHVKADRTTGLEKKLAAREAVIWDQAARMLRDTEIVEAAE